MFILVNNIKGRDKKIIFQGGNVTASVCRLTETWTRQAVNV